MNKITHLLRQRRVWAFLVPVITVILGKFGFDYIDSPEVMVESLTNIGHLLAETLEASAALISGLLALWSYIKPKTK